ncbi:MAG TPA: GNAT family protein [Solirubrobacterales bacterium]|nr:GNAT family protein [Solirubrobacterales bacterium]
MVIKRVDRTPLGLVVAYQANFQDGYAYVAAAKFEPKQKSPLMILGIVMFINYVFSCWNFRKLYMEVPEYNLPQFSSRIDRYFTVEGTLREHIYSVGRYWDQFILSVDRSTWQERGQLLTQMALKES